MNGKMIIVIFLYQLFRKLGYKVGLLLIIENWINECVLSINLMIFDVVKFNECL